MAVLWIALAVLCVLVGLAAFRLRQVRAMEPAAPGWWPFTERFAPCAGQCPTEEPHLVHRDGSMTCQRCHTTTVWSPR